MANNFNILDEKTWDNASDASFVWNDDTCFNEENGKNINEKEMIAFLRQLFSIIDNTISKQKTINYGREKVISFVLDSIFAKVEPEDIPSEVLVLVDMGIEPNLVHTVYQSMKKNINNKQVEQNINKNSNNLSSKQDIASNQKINYTPITDNSNPGPFLFLGILSVVVCLITFIRATNVFFDPLLDTGKIVSAIILPFIALIVAFIFFNKYSKEKNEKQYYEVCKSMEYWLGKKSDELIISWGTPTKTSKLPNDKSISIMEYKDSIRNYMGYSAGVSSSRMRVHMGQSKSTKYIKTFFAKDGYIIDYKYSIQ